MPSLLALKVLFPPCWLRQSLKRRSGGNKRSATLSIHREAVLLPTNIFIAIVALYRCFLEPDSCQGLPWNQRHVKRYNWGTWPLWLSWLGVLPCKVKGCQFDSQSGHRPGLQVQSPFGVHRRGKPSMLLSHTDVSLLLSLPPFPSLYK